MDGDINSTEIAWDFFGDMNGNNLQCGEFPQSWISSISPVEKSKEIGVSMGIPHSPGEWHLPFQHMFDDSNPGRNLTVNLQ